VKEKLNVNAVAVQSNHGKETPFLLPAATQMLAHIDKSRRKQKVLAVDYNIITSTNISYRIPIPAKVKIVWQFGGS
jgi:hypothetical protein